MAHQNEGNPKTVSRRSILQTGALVAAAALVPATARAAAVRATTDHADLLKDTRRWYREFVESWAERKRVEFEAGTLHAWNDADNEAAEDNGWSGYTSSFDGFKEEIREESLKDYGAIYLVLAVSPNEPPCSEEAETPYRAAECVARDVLYIARARGWYTPVDEELMGELLNDEPNVLYGPIPA